MNYTFKVLWSKDGSINPDMCGDSGEPPFINLGSALAEANKHIRSNRTVTVLRADSEGVNAGKYFLHYIVK